MQDISAGEQTGSVPETDGLRDLTVRNFLQLPHVKFGNPVVLAGQQHLDTPVRWVHIAETDAVTDLLEGGEMLLSSSPAFQHSVENTRAFLDQARRAGPWGSRLRQLTRWGSPAPALLRCSLRPGGERVCPS